MLLEVEETRETASARVDDDFRYALGSDSESQQQRSPARTSEHSIFTKVQHTKFSLSLLPRIASNS